MANASPELIWAIVRDTSCHILKQRVSGKSGMGKRGAEFTMEPNNPTSKNAWKYSGLANPKTADVTATEGGVILTTKTKDPARVGKVRLRRRVLLRWRRREQSTSARPPALVLCASGQQLATVQRAEGCGCSQSWLCVRHAWSRRRLTARRCRGRRRCAALEVAQQGDADPRLPAGGQGHR
jgi:hypothetical protein